MHKKYVLTKNYTIKDGTLKQGDEITLLRDNIYYNGGMVMPSYYGTILNLVRDEKLRNEYLKEVSIIYNKV